MEKKLEIKYELLDRDTVPSEVGRLLNDAEIAITSSHAPYSNFHVGAVLLLEDGSSISGSNQENAAFPIGFCAERVALAARVSTSPDTKIKAIGIATMNRMGKILPPIAPCGMCRQALLEEEIKQGSPIGVYLSGNNGTVMYIRSVSELLPFGFEGNVFND